MINKGLSPHIILSLIRYYDEARMLVNKNEEYSDIFKTEIGVRQGGIASPKLFSLYLEELLDMITLKNVGVEIGKSKIDVIAYADDIIIISTTKIGLQETLDMVAQFGTRFEIKFNPDKTIWMVFNSKIKRTVVESRRDSWQGELILDGKIIERVSVFKYLGVEINEENTDKDHLENRKKAAQRALSKLKHLDIICDKTNYFLKGHLYKTYIMPVLYYGSENLDLKKTNINKLERLENNLIRSIYNLPKRSKMTNLKRVINIDSTTSRMKRMHVEFFERLLSNSYTQCQWRSQPFSDGGAQVLKVS